MIMQSEVMERLIDDIMAIDTTSGLILTVLTGILIANVWLATKLHELRVAVTEKPLKPGTTPSHVVFSDKVLCIPPLPGFLDRPLWVQNPSTDGFAPFRQQGHWIERGDTIVRLVIKNPIFPPIPVIARIQSPISGRLLYTNSSFLFGSVGQQSTDWLNFLCVIEIPVGEEVSTSMHTTFREFCDLLWEHRESVLHKPKDGSFPPYSDEVIRSELDALLGREAEIISKDEGTYRRQAEWLNLHVPHGIGSQTNVVR